MTVKQKPVETVEALGGWVGKSYQKWCANDTNDERKINYTLHKGGLEPETFRFTSDGYVDGLMLYRVQQSDIKSLSLEGDEWHVELNYLC